MLGFFFRCADKVHWIVSILYRCRSDAQRCRPLISLLVTPSSSSVALRNFISANSEGWYHSSLSWSFDACGDAICCTSGKKEMPRCRFAAVAVAFVADVDDDDDDDDDDSVEAMLTKSGADVNADVALGLSAVAVVDVME